MTKYQNGKVYKIEPLNGEEGDIYVGSTAKQYLSQRMTKHRELYKLWKKGKGGANMSSYHLFDKYGIENCSIMLLETYPCNSKDELRGREGFHMRNLECVKKRIEGRTPAEYYQDNREIKIQYSKDFYENNTELCSERAKLHYQNNREKIKEKSNNYYANNKESVLEASKNYYDNNKERILEYQLTYYQKNKEIVDARNKEYAESHKEELAKYKKEHYEKNKIRLQENITCECGSTCSRMSLSGHKKTLIHKNYENSLIQT